MNTGDVYFGKREMYFDVHTKPTFVLALTFQLAFGYSLIYLGILCTHVGIHVGYFTYSKCKVASLLWFAHCGKRFFGSAQILIFFPSSGSHKNSAHFPGELIGHG